jgi:hypothetical protein
MYTFHASGTQTVSVWLLACGLIRFFHNRVQAVKKFYSNFLPPILQPWQQHWEEGLAQEEELRWEEQQDS